MKYLDLSELLAKEPQAQTYFNKLPKNVKQQIQSQSKSIDSFDSLRNYAENLNHSNS
ncbi:MAG: hypothetical protein LKK00_03000 [Intestinimonas sp.]|jgi:hypothetical protein|nr:hypothetical protein [Intestinimonas sp.]